LRRVVQALALIVVVGGRLAGQQSRAGVVAGRVVDAATSEGRAGASVSVAGTTRGAIADSLGRFVIDGLTPGSIVLQARMLGYKTTDQRVAVTSGDTTRVEIRLEQSAVVLGAMRSEARPIDRELFATKPNVGTVSITAHAAEGVPKFGEPDVMRVVQLLPGVEARNDFSTGLNVRGGEADQNLILMDGYPIYNPFHLGGLFSTFIDPMVGDITLMTGGFPARYGGRLSSVLEVNSAEETRPGLHGTGEVSVLASTLQLGSAFAGGKGSWSIGGRRTYADKFVELISTNELPYHFRDEQAHASYAFTPTTKLSFTLYDGRDALDANIASFGDSTSANPSGGTFSFGWGNTVGGLTLSKSYALPSSSGIARLLFGTSGTIEQRGSVSHFSTALDLGAGALTLNNVVTDARLGGSLTTYTAGHDRTYGYDVAQYRISYLAKSPQTATLLYDLSQRPVSGSVYIDDLWRAGSRWLIESGLRGDALSGRPWAMLAPRLSAKFFVDSNFALTGAVGRFAQWTHSLAREDIPVRLFDFWLASDSGIPVSSAWHYIGGMERWYGTSRLARVEGFYKQYGTLLESNPQEDPEMRGDEFYPVQGNSYGVDVLLRQFETPGHRFSGWIAYTYAVAVRTQDTLRYFPGHDRRHDVNIVGTWRLANYTFGARLGYATGTPYTDIVGEIVRRVYDPGFNASGTRGGTSTPEFVGGPRNGARLPTTQRLDLDVARTYHVREMTVAPYLSVVNAYDAKNVFLYVFDYSKAPPTREAISQFPILPSVGVTIRF
jgi:hypothetical protein